MDVFRRIFTPSKEITMKTTRRFLSAAISMALAFIFFGCSSGGGGGGHDDTGSGGIVRGTFTDSRDGKTYEWVQIGSQRWMAENLNYNANGSVCYKNDPANCETYGKLYDWTTAMDISENYNNSFYGIRSCGVNCYNPAVTPHKGICPSGWHIPDGVEWATLMRYVNDGISLEYYHTMGNKLRATSGWSDGNGRSGNGTDDYGFAALPGGRSSNGSFFYVGYEGHWWTATEHGDEHAFAIGLIGGKNNVIVGYGVSIGYDLQDPGFYKSDLASIRCVQDNNSELPSSSSTIVKGTLTDSRDGKTYKTVVIGNQTWMAENLNYNASGSICSYDKPENCAELGRLYNWTTAMDIDDSYAESIYGTVPCGDNYCKDDYYNPAITPHQGICPSGWHIPVNAEWAALVGNSDIGDAIPLRAVSGWNLLVTTGLSPGTDDYGFAALPGGDYGLGGGYGFRGVGREGYWWSATDGKDVTGSDGAGNNSYSYHADFMFIGGLTAGTGYHFSGLGKRYSMASVRCVKDN
jgi:uncharacterized protein (TIGR02145 family)